MGAARYDEFADWYHDWVGEDAEPGSLPVATADALGDLSGCRALDLACGSGMVARLLADRGATVVGVDLSARLIEKAVEIEQRTRRGVRYLVGDAQGTDWWDGRPFDAAVCNMGLTDIENLDAAMHTVSTVLRQGAPFAFSVAHPCFPGHGEGLPAWPPHDGYYCEKWWTTDGGGCRGHAGAHHRTLSTLLNAPLARGLRIEHVDEPQIPNTPDVPFLLLVLCRRGDAPAP